MEQVYYLILVPMVYLAYFVFFAGIIVRSILIWRRPAFAPTLQIFPEKKPAWLWALGDIFLLPGVRKSNPVLWFFLMVFHLCILLLILGHLELIKDFAFIQVIEHEIFLGRGFVGLITALALLFLLFRRFVSPTKDLSVPEDYFLVILLFLTVIFGSEMDWARRWYDYGGMGVDDYREYLWSMVTFHPDVYAVTQSGHSFMLVLHVFFANLFLMFFPFTKLMHAITTFPMNKIRRG